MRSTVNSELVIIAAAAERVNWKLSFISCQCHSQTLNQTSAQLWEHCVYEYVSPGNVCGDVIRTCCYLPCISGVWRLGTWPVRWDTDAADWRARQWYDATTIQLNYWTSYKTSTSVFRVLYENRTRLFRSHVMLVTGLYHDGHSNEIVKN